MPASPQLTNQTTDSQQNVEMFLTELDMRQIS